MEKRKVTFIITIIGLLIIITSAVIIKLQDNVKEKDNTILKATLLSNTKKCIEDEVCTGENIEITTLINNGYISEENKKELEEYSNDSFISYPSRNVYLIKKIDKLADN